MRGHCLAFFWRILGSVILIALLTKLTLGHGFHKYFGNVVLKFSAKFPFASGVTSTEADRYQIYCPGYFGHILFIIENEIFKYFWFLKFLYFSVYVWKWLWFSHPRCNSVWPRVPRCISRSGLWEPCCILQTSQTPEVASLTLMGMFIELGPLWSRYLVLTITGIPWLAACGCIPVSSVFPSLTDCLLRRTVQFWPSKPLYPLSTAAAAWFPDEITSWITRHCNVNMSFMEAAT